MSMEAPLVSALPPPSTLPANKHANQQLIFDFTKRKKWADLLVTELTEVIILVLSESGVVMYCSPAVEDLLGWQDEELVDMNFCDVMNDEDKNIFQRQFAESIERRTDLLSYARLRCKSEQDVYGPNIPPQSTKSPSKEVLFEIKGYPHFIVGPTLAQGSNGFNVSELQTMAAMEAHAGPSNGVQSSNREVFKCFFAMAKPYPSRNTAMLNTFLELKMENERLQQRLRDAKAKAEALDRAQAQRQSLASYSLPQQTPYPGTGTTRNPNLPPSQSFAWTLNSAAAGPSRTFDSRQFYPGLADAAPIGNSSASVKGSSASTDYVGGERTDPSADQTLPRKKSKRSLTQELYCCMTCGRTDSPEWRKGPQGPKTLCNACGLRWAKSVRTTSTSAGEGDPSTEIQAATASEL